MLVAPQAQGKVGLLRENFAGALAYLTFVPAALFLLVQPYKKNPFLRFHSAQCLLVWGCGILAGVVFRGMAILLFLIPVAGPLLALLISVVAALAVVLTWVVLVIKALQGEMFRLPWLGALAARFSGGV